MLALADAMPRRYALLVFIGAGAGLRQGEAFGLALDRIDAGTGMITVDQQVVIVERDRYWRHPRRPRRFAMSPCHSVRFTP